MTAWRDALGLLPIGLALLVLAWNVTLAGWIAARREGPPWFSRLTGLAGLLVAPAAIIAVAASTDAGARTITGVAWLWPATCVLLVLQAVAATALRFVSASVGVPIACYNALLAAVAIGDDLVARAGIAPLLLQGGVAARDSVLGIVMGRAALTTPLALVVPLLAPAYPARWRASALVRALLVLYATVTATLLAIEWPRGIAVVTSYAAATRTVEPRDPSRFVLGARVFPTLDGAPPTRAVRAAARLDERLSPEAVLAVVRASDMSSRDLDSLARVLAPARAAGRRVLLAVEFSRDDAIAVRRDGAEARRRHLAALARALERVRPDVIVPALRPLAPALRGAPGPSASWWRDFLTDAAREAARVRPATTVAWIATRFDATDSAVYRWAARAEAPVTALGFAPTPSFSGLPSLDARLRAADRWQAAAATQRPHWIVTAGLPRAHGDDAQRDAIRHVVAWASRRPWVTGVLVGEPSDDEALLGLVGANGRERAVVDMLARLR